MNIDNVNIRVIPNLGIYISIFFAFLTIFITFLFVLPLQLRLSRVKNGLRPLRLLLLIFGFSFIATNIILEFFFVTNRV